MEQSPSWESNSNYGSQETPRRLWEPNVHDRVHKSPPLFPILSQMIPFYNLSLYFSNIHKCKVFLVPN